MNFCASPIIRKILIVLIMFLSSSCATTSLEKTNSYANQVFYFSYPGNWKIIDDRISNVSGMLEFKTPEKVTIIIHYTPEYTTLETMIREYYSKFDFVKTYNNEVVSIEKTIGKNKILGYERQYEYSLLDDEFWGLEEYYSMHSATSNIYFYIKYNNGSRSDSFTNGLNYLQGTFKFKTP